MSRFTRRVFLKTSSAAVIAAGAITAVPGLPAAVGVLGEAGPADTGAAETAFADAENPSLGEPLVAHLRDLEAGEIALFSGTREVTVLDPSLAARLLRAL